MSYENTHVAFKEIPVDMLRLGVDLSIQNLELNINSKTAFEVDVAENVVATIVNETGSIVFRRARDAQDVVVTSSITLPAGNYSVTGTEFDSLFGNGASATPGAAETSESSATTSTGQ